MIQLKDTQDVHEYRDIFEGFQSTFGEKHWWAILAYCNVIVGRDDAFWRQYLIQDEELNTIGTCGLFSMRPDNNEELWLGWFGILKDFRHQNYATEALFKMKELALSLKCKRLLLYTDAKTGPIEFYKKQGFSVIGTVEEFIASRRDSVLHRELPNLTDIVMELHLQS